MSGFLAEHVDLATLALVVREYVLRAAMLVLVLVRKGSRPSVASGWMVLVLTLPVVGAILYFTVGETRFGRRRIRRHRNVLARIDQPRFHEFADPAVRTPTLGQVERELSTLARAVSHGVVCGGNRIDLTHETEDTIGAMIAAIDGAAKHCHLLFYI